MKPSYVHGYKSRENERLQDQAGALVDLLHHDTAYPAGSGVLEVGCGIGAQTLILAKRSPGARFTSIDISADSLATAKQDAVLFRRDDSDVLRLIVRCAHECPETQTGCDRINVDSNG